MKSTIIGEIAPFFASYPHQANLLDEVFDSSGKAKKSYEKILKFFNKFSLDDLKRLNDCAKLSFFNQGVTFAVYNENMKGIEKIFPFDLFPRIIPNEEWQKIEKGIIQRNIAINMFLHDIYHKKMILREGIIPAELIFSSNFYLKEMMNFSPIGGIYTQICGTDLIKHKDGEYYVLEDNLRCPSGVSYVLSNREAMKKTLSGIYLNHKVMPVQEYPEQLLSMMQSMAPDGVDEPNCVVLTPGMYNSAYYEHSFLAQSMGIQLVEGRDLYVDRNFVYMKTIHGPKRVDVIYRRVDDEFLDPLCFRPDSMLGVPALMGSYLAGNVNIINAPGTGAADDKAVYSYLPEMIRYYLSEEPILRNVKTYRCEIDEDLKFVLNNLDELVVKPVDESGGYGVFIGNRATTEQKKKLTETVKRHRRKYIAQPIMSLSVHSTYIEEEEYFEPRHIDLRSFCLMGKGTPYVLKGGLSRVALKRGSLIVNSSQGGGSKDTWVLAK
jgi:uncharacterized circularly permuted ATP-grasp superfamily protein